MTTIDVCGVSSSSDDGNVAENTIDNDLSTRWSAFSVTGEWVEYDLCGSYDLNQMDIAWFKGDQRISYFRIETSEDRSYWSRSFVGGSAGDTSDFESFFFTSQNTRYIRIKGFGNTLNNWVSVSEVKIYGDADPTDYTLNAVSDLQVTEATATELTLTWTDNSTNEDGYLIEKVSSWSGEYYDYRIVTDNAARVYDLDRSGTHQFRVSPIKADEVGPSIEIQTEFEYFSDAVIPVSVDASSDDGNVAENTLDDDANTRWSAKGEGEYITLDLGDRYIIDSVNIAFHKGDTRQASFKFYCSGEGDHFYGAEDDEGLTSSGTTSGYEEFDTYCSYEGIRYLRIVGYGNTANDWNSISDIQLTGALTRVLD